MLAKIPDVHQWACPFANFQPCRGPACAVARIDTSGTDGAPRIFCGAGSSRGVFLSMRLQPDRPFVPKGSTDQPAAKVPASPRVVRATTHNPPARPPSSDAPGEAEII